MAQFVFQRTRESVPTAHRAHANAIARSVLESAHRFEIDPIILMSVIYNESRFNPKALGRHGEIGLMQIRPCTAFWMLSTGKVQLPERYKSEAAIAKALYEPATNIKVGVAYLAYMRRVFPSSDSLYIAAYNMGPGSVQNLLRQGKQPRRYTDLVLSTHATLSRDLAEHRRLIQTTASTFDLR